MAVKTKIKKSAVRTVEKGGLSVEKVKRLSRAAAKIDKRNIKALILTGKVRKLNVQNGTNPVYMYRMSPRERILFSVDKGQNLIHDVVDIETNQSIFPAEGGHAVSKQEVIKAILKK
ncbi:hypothetical protein JS518_14325 [Clostridiales bacterium FE2010]|nr:hypothetical protein JS518_14325 [Clostridiales bacterium FE2010]